MSFADRHIGLHLADVNRMLEVVGDESLETLMSAAVPGTGIRTPGSAAAPPRPRRRTSPAVRYLAANCPAEPMIGLGYHGTLTPPVIRRNVLEDPSWYTAYTPYQAGDLPGAPRGAAQLPDGGRVT